MADDRFMRTRLMVGDEGLARLGAARVVVVGLGAVGSYATEALARSGVGRLRLVDHDTVAITNINRQLVALESTLGMPKVDVARARVLDINPQCEVEAVQSFAHIDTFDALLSGPPDIVLDCIDALTPKVELICACIERGLAVVSSMGAALRSDPSRVRTGPITEATCCPLARRVRKLLRRRGMTTDVPCVYSSELVDRALVSRLTALPAETAAHHPGRPRHLLASLPTLTGIFGLTVAHVALMRLLRPADAGAGPGEESWAG